MAILGRKTYPARVSGPSDLSGISIDDDLFALVAAAVQYTSSDEENVLRRTLPIWQRQAMEFYDLLGECWFPAQFYARQLSRVRLYPGILQPNGEVEETDEAGAQEILARVADQSGGRAGWLKSYGQLAFLVGDGNLVVTERDGDEVWEYLSMAEFQRNGKDGFKRIVEPGAAAKDLRLAPAGASEIRPGQARAWRLWTRHPLHSNVSDAPIRSVLPLYQYLMLVDKAAAAQALSRIVGSGLLVIADEITIPASDAEADDQNAEDDPFVSRLTKHVITPISNPGSAAAVAPLVARIQIGDKTIDDVIKLINLHDPNQTADWQQRIEKAITRIAVGLDMPPEEFLGLAQANHWTGWVITEEKWKAHGEPLTIQLCTDLTSGYYRPACRAAKIPNAEKLVVWYDAARVVTHPDQGKDANEVFDRGGLNLRGLRRAHNFQESDAMIDPEEKALFAALKFRTPPRQPDAPQEPVSGTGADVESGPAGNGSDPGPRTRRPSPMNDGQMNALSGAALVALAEARRRAGNVIWNKRMQCEQCFRGMADVPRYELVAKVGVDVVRALGYSGEQSLVSGGCETFVYTALALGVPEQKARLIAGLIEKHAAATLYEESPTLPAEVLAET